MGAFMVAGCVGIGFLLPDILLAYSNKKVIIPLKMSILSAMSCGSIAAYFVF